MMTRTKTTVATFALRVASAYIAALFTASASVLPANNATEKNTAPTSIEAKPTHSLDQITAPEAKPNTPDAVKKSEPTPLDATPIEISKPCPIVCGGGKESKERFNRS